MVELAHKQRMLVRSCLKDLDFVNWDRFIDMLEDGGRILKIYGWIDRVKDKYKDFVVLIIHLDDLTVGYVTSSDKYTKKIQLILYGTNNEAHHNECMRVEANFSIKNCVRLENVK